MQNTFHISKMFRIFQIQFCRKFTNKPLEIEDKKLDTKEYLDMKKYLRTQNIQQKEGPTCLQLECRLCKNCNNQANVSAPLAYINKRTGIFLCPSCDVKSTLANVLTIYQNPERRMQRVHIPKLYDTKFFKLAPITQNVCDRLRLPGLTAEQLTAIGGLYEPTQELLHFELRNVANKVVGEKVYNLLDKSEETFQHSGNTGIIIYGPANKNKALLVSNILDFIVLATQRIESHSIVCLPYSLQQLPQGCLPALERFKELVFWFDFDSIGWDIAKSFANKMDEKRCLLIRSTEKEPAPHIALRKRLNLRHIISKALPVCHRSITNFNALRNDILSELQNIEKVNGIKWKRFPVLNKLLKGHRKGELTILTGPTGSGKTTFISEYSLDLALQGVSTLWGSFEIRNSRLASTMLRQYVGYALNDKLNEFDYWATQFERYPLYFMTFHGQQALKVVMEAIEHAQYIHDISHVIIDNLQFMMGVSIYRSSDKFWEQDAIIAAFRSFATKHNVHVTLVMHPRKERQEDDLTTSSVFGTAKATQEADNVLIIQDKRLTSVRGKKYLQIAKNRYSGDLGVMPLEFDKNALSYATNFKRKREKEKTAEES